MNPAALWDVKDLICGKCQAWTLYTEPCSTRGTFPSEREWVMKQWPQDVWEESGSQHQRQHHTEPFFLWDRQERRKKRRECKVEIKYMNVQGSSIRWPTFSKNKGFWEAGSVRKWAKEWKLLPSQALSQGLSLRFPICWLGPAPKHDLIHRTQDKGKSWNKKKERQITEKEETKAKGQPWTRPRVGQWATGTTRKSSSNQRRIRIKYVIEPNARDNVNKSVIFFYIHYWF